jgi:precorrin-8X/cobalt-precorrin-8 methylmutase
MPPDAIERESPARIDHLLAGHHFDMPAERALARRLVYASGDPSLADRVRLSPGALERGVAALRAAAPIVVDVQMVAAGVTPALRGQLGCPLLCAARQERAAEAARAGAITRTAAGLLLLGDRLDGAVVAIGNAPTALLALLDLVDQGRAAPALVVGMPVGFVAAAESKELLRARAVPFVTVVGTRGGSPLAAATLNLLLGWAAGDGVPTADPSAPPERR